MSSRYVFVTGASRGIGLALVKRILQASDWKVVATYRSKKESVDLLSLKTKYRGRLDVIELDVGSEASYKSAISELHFLGINAFDVVIANAGVAHAVGGHQQEPSMLDTTAQDMHDVYHTNVVGSLLTVQYFHDFLLQGRYKLVLFLSSTLGSVEATAGMPNNLSYRTSKAALNMLASVVAEEPKFRAYGGKVLAVNPGWVQTDIGNAVGSGVVQKRAGASPTAIASSPSQHASSLSSTLTPPFLTADQAVAPLWQLVEVACTEQDRVARGGKDLDIAGPKYDKFLTRMRTGNCVFTNTDGTTPPL